MKTDGSQSVFENNNVFKQKITSVNQGDVPFLQE